MAFLDDTDGSRARPAVLIEADRRILAAKVTDGARQIRVLGQITAPGSGAAWDECAVPHLAESGMKVQEQSVK